MASINAQEQLIKAVDEWCAPIEFALQSDANAKLLFKALGWDFNRVDGFPFNDLLTSLSNIYNILLDVRDLINNPPDSIELFTEYLEVLLSLFEAIGSISNFISGVSGGGMTAAFKDEFGKLPVDILNFMVCGYLESNHFQLYATLSVLGIISPYQTTGLTAPVSATNEPWVRLPYNKSIIHLNYIVDLLTDPVTYFKQQFYPASGTLNTAAEAQEFSDKFFPRLALLFQSLGFDTSYGMDPGDETLYTSDAFSVMNRTLTITYHTADLGNYGASISISPTSQGGHGLVVGLFGDWSYNTKIADWLLYINATAVIDVLSINDSGIHFPSSFSDIEFSILIQLIRLSANDALLGSTTGTRFDIKEISVGSYINYAYEDTSYGFAAAFKGIELLIGGEGDSFINNIIPNGAGGKFDLSFAWDSVTGFHFNASGGLEYQFPIHKKIGPVDFQSATVGIYLDGGKINIKGGGDIALNIGPIDASVKNIGIIGEITFPETDANLGICNLDVKFKFPTGAALAIDAPPVKGGGFLNYNEATSTYTGGLELNFSKISFAAIGIISTKLPGGEDGYSLLIVITAEFGPLPLGMGFTLNGLGGILGLHRTMNPDVLRTGIRDNTLDHILFPKDIVKNANTIISNIGQAFPIMKDQFLIGPMAKIGWGTPTLLTIELGIIIELPEPVRLAILGVIKALLPSKENAILKIQVNFLGIIDFTNKYLSFDASLYDSKILTFGLFGDMALRLYWGDKPNFLLSVGGFHPKFTPPPLNLPDMRRLSIVLADSNNLKIAVETYFAITSNSVQFGAKVAAMARAWKIQAIGALWFDILFQFRPFYFIADMGVMFAIKMGSKTLLSLFVNLSLEGPNPWRAQGKGSFKILFVKVSVSFDKTFGQARVEAIEAVKIDDKLKDALTQKDNWEALLPERNSQQVGFREEEEGSLSVDPAGALKISQRLLPLDTELQKFGSAAISDFKRYDLVGVTLGGTSIPTQKVQDYFARNEFFNMTDDEKLSRDSYELFDAGLIAGNDSSASSDYAVHRKCDYEQITLDSGYRKPELRFVLSAELLAVHDFGNYISRSGLSAFDRITTSSGPNRTQVSLADDAFVIANRDTLNQVGSVSFSNSADAERYLADQIAATPASAADWIIANRFELA